MGVEKIIIYKEGLERASEERERGREREEGWVGGGGGVRRRALTVKVSNGTAMTRKDTHEHERVCARSHRPMWDEQVCVSVGVRAYVVFVCTCMEHLSLTALCKHFVCNQCSCCSCCCCCCYLYSTLGLFQIRRG